MKIITLITAKHYKAVFGITYSTAKIWFKDDLQTIKRKRMTMEQFEAIYKGVEPLAASVRIKKD